MDITDKRCSEDTKISFYKSQEKGKIILYKGRA